MKTHLNTKMIIILVKIYTYHDNIFNKDGYFSRFKLQILCNLYLY